MENVIASLLQDLPSNLNFSEEESKTLEYWVSLTTMFLKKLCMKKKAMLNKQNCSAG
jgi:hypothetical protein